MGLLARLWAIIMVILWVSVMFIGTITFFFVIYWILFKGSFYDDLWDIYRDITKWTDVYT